MKDKQLNNREKKRRRQENIKTISIHYKTKSKPPHLEVLSTNYATSSLILRLWAREAKTGKGYKLPVFLILFRGCVHSVLTIMPVEVKGQFAGVGSLPHVDPRNHTQVGHQV